MYFSQIINEGQLDKFNFFFNEGSSQNYDGQIVKNFKNTYVKQLK